MKLIIKICGLRRVEDAELSMDLGADYLGCVMAKDSPRRATVEEVRRIVAAARNRAAVVLAFRGNSAAEILSICGSTGVRRVQIHGVDPLACGGLRFYGLIIHPVFAVDPRSQTLPLQEPTPSIDRPGLLDTGKGGTGEAFGWRLLGDQCPAATLIAGGINPHNVVSLLRRRPFGIDVSSGVESRPGRKDPSLLRALFAEAKAS